ncbi:Diaphanous autoregulatory [Penicillium maclennaniae]|uniref:Diaphanous autoregulatory n=1 Tax=Penicillium maclennaniae TaxID=1343394 RepID=UPI00254026D8|nr:Diaphanous autoregulatory [Penicillium maclennaniae]KAJ5674824.1 Diaphanous autoregulatory [Penicillium maclennaniae]
MDSLLEKLRAAAPQAKDQRDRRRRARLKERHQVRVASGQKPPEADGEEGEEVAEKPADGDTRTVENGLLSPPIPEDGAEAKEVSEGEDVADRAASMLLGLRSNSDATGGDRARRRRESADEERRNRRMRRRNGASGSKDSADGGLPAVQEPQSPSRIDSISTENALPSPPHEEAPPSEPPSIVVSEQTDASESEAGSSPSQPIEVSD